MAVALGIRRPSGVDESLIEPPAAVVAGYPCTTVEPRWFLAERGPQGEWAETPPVADLAPYNFWFPKVGGFGPFKTAEETQEHVRTFTAAWWLLYGRPTGWGLARDLFSESEATALSPLGAARARLAGGGAARSSLPAVLMMLDEWEQIIPLSQQELFSEVYRAAGGELSGVVFRGVDHAHASYRTPAGFDALLSFLDHHGISSALDGSCATKPDAECVWDDLVREQIWSREQPPFGFERGIYDASRHANSTVWLSAVDEDAAREWRRKYFGSDVKDEL